METLSQMQRYHFFIGISKLKETKTLSGKFKKQRLANPSEGLLASLISSPPWRSTAEDHNSPYGSHLRRKQEPESHYLYDGKLQRSLGNHWRWWYGIMLLQGLKWKPTISQQPSAVGFTSGTVPSRPVSLFRSITATLIFMSHHWHRSCKIEIWQ